MSAQVVGLNSLNNQNVVVSLGINEGNITLRLFLRFNATMGYWMMDIANQNGLRIVSCIPLLTGSYPGANILAPYAYLNIGTAYIINVTGTTAFDYPGQNNLGTDFVLLWDSQPGPPGFPGPQGVPGLNGNAGIAPSGIYVMGTGGTLTPVLASNFTQQANLAADAVIAAPTISHAGDMFLVQIVQDSAGGHAVTWNSFYKGLAGVVIDPTPLTQFCAWFQVDTTGSFAQVMQVCQNGWSTL